MTDFRHLVSLLPQPPRLIVDVGANRGEWTAEMRRRAPKAEYHLFEPAPDMAAALRKRFGESVHVHEAALSSRDGRHAFALFPNRLMSSLETLDAGAAYYAGDPGTPETLDVRTLTLDAVWRDILDGREIDLLKLDAQGHDAAILAASVDALRHIHALLVEWEIIPLYAGSWDFTRLHALLVAKGFYLQDLLYEFRAGGRIAWADALYLAGRYSRLESEREAQ